MGVQDIDFGVRYCPLCKGQIPAQLFGRHVLAIHGARTVALRWPGGSIQFIRDLITSIDESLERSHDYPEVQYNLRHQRELMVLMLSDMEGDNDR